MNTKPRTNVIGMRFGRLTAVEDAGKQHGRNLVRCRCDCGGECVVIQGNLTSGNTRSCGCLYKETRKGREKKEK